MGPPAPLSAARCHLRGLRQRSGTVRLGARVTGLARSGSMWKVESTAGCFEAGVIVNATGAWADQVGVLGGARAIDLEPRKRNASIITPAGCGRVHDWSVVFDIGAQFYFKPDVDNLLVSPEDEIVSAPGDARPDEFAVAEVVDRIERAARIRFPTKPVASWAGLRSFVRDEAPVVGPDPRCAGLVWAAALGGSGIKTAPAVARSVAALATGRPIPEDVARAGVTEAMLSPERLR